MRLRRRPGAALITSAATSRSEEIRSRERRYVVTMLSRALLFVLAVVAFSGWVRFLAIGLALIMPWVAVVVANGGPPNSRREAGRAARPGPTSADAPPATELTAPRHEVIDQESVSRDGTDRPA